MLKIKDKINIFLLLSNIIFLLYYSLQLLIFTDEFAINNLGFFNHAIAGLAEIIGIIFFSLSLGLVAIFFIGLNKQLPILITIFLMHSIISINFWRYVATNSPGETNLDTIAFNASIFSFVSFAMLILILRSKYS
tara:strand:+ start:184 stop:588 length:405 start_codon:yes stop_codon:yes gene_type:complete